ncbi:hypothetical protein HMPREF0731_1030, partial [Pseudoroseomonas cervicalis ATCC 49957]
GQAGQAVGRRRQAGALACHRLRGSGERLRRPPRAAHRVQRGRGQAAGNRGDRHDPIIRDRSCRKVKRDPRHHTRAGPQHSPATPRQAAAPVAGWPPRAAPRRPRCRATGRIPNRSGRWWRRIRTI